MGIEIERKFIVTSGDYKKDAIGVLYRQGYLSITPEKVVRARIVDTKGFLTIKGPSIGNVRPEFEYEIPVSDAHQMLDTLCEKPIIEKYRYTTRWGGFVWEIDEFLGENQGLVIAEIELESENQEFPLPPWAGREVTGDSRYYNASLTRKPYASWKERA